MTDSPEHKPIHWPRALWGTPLLESAIEYQVLSPPRLEALRESLTEIQFRRVKSLAEGLTVAQIAAQEGISDIATRYSLQGALNRLIQAYQMSTSDR